MGNIDQKSDQLVLLHYDDGKEKWQSHEVSAGLYDTKNNKLKDYGLFDICGYGETRLEALKEFKKELDDLILVMNHFEGIISETIKKEETGESVSYVEIDCLGKEIKK